MKRILVFLGVMLLFFCTVGVVSATPLPAEYELINPDTVGTPSYTAGSDLGYFIWTDDAARESWHIRWSGNGPTIHNFSGSIALENNVFGVIDDFSFEVSGYFDNFSVNVDNNGAGYFAYANVGEDGLDFTINNIALPAYVGFDLLIDFSQNNAASNTYIGANNETVDDGDFKIAAPVPEPATMFLLGTGLIGLAGLGRKKVFKKQG